MPSTYISFRGNIYKQIYGTAMGSPVSVVVANLVMESKELATFPQKIRFWKPYFDDVCCLLPEVIVAPFLLHLNEVEPSEAVWCVIYQLDYEQHNSDILDQFSSNKFCVIDTLVRSL